MTERLTRPFQRLRAVLAVLVLTLGITAATTLLSPAAQASTCGNVYEGTWRASDPNGRLITIVIDFPNCSNWSSVKVHVVSHSFLGLPPNNPTYWGYSKNVTWGYVGTSLTARYYFNGLTESLYIRPPSKYVGLPVTETQYFANSSDPHVLPVQYFHRA